jgi:hypothetical protein
VPLASASGDFEWRKFVGSLHVAMQRPEAMKTRRAMYRRLSKAAEGFVIKPLDDD